MKYKEIKFIKKVDGMYNINLSSVYDNNCCDVLQKSEKPSRRKYRRTA